MKIDELLALLSSSLTSLDILALLPRTELVEYLQSISNFQCEMIQLILEGKKINYENLEKYTDKFMEIAKEAQDILSSNRVFKDRR